MKETRLFGSCINFKPRAPPFLPEERKCAYAVFSESSCVTYTVVLFLIRHVGFIKKHTLRDVQL